LVQSDDRLALEYSAPRAIYGRYQTNNVERLRAVAAAAQPPPAVAALRASATATDWRHRAAMQMKADSAPLAYQDYLEALRIMPDDRDALAGLVAAAAASGRLDAAETYLRGRIRLCDAATQIGLRGVETPAGRGGRHQPGERVSIVGHDPQRLEVVLVGERRRIGLHLHRRAMTPVGRGCGRAQRGYRRRRLRRGRDRTQ